MDAERPTQHELRSPPGVREADAQPDQEGVEADARLHHVEARHPRGIRRGRRLGHSLSGAASCGLTGKQHLLATPRGLVVVAVWLHMAEPHHT